MLSCPDLKISGPIQDAYPNPYPRPEISLPLSKLNSYLSSNLSAEQAQEILQRLEFESRLEDQNLIVTAPSFRATGDINIYQDIIEEIGRIYGYYNIQSQIPDLKQGIQFENKTRKFEHNIKNFLANTGYYEALNYCFYGEHIIDSFELNLNSHIKLKNALSKEAFAMRTTLLPNLVQSLLTNKQEKSDIKFSKLVEHTQKSDSSSPPKSSNSPLSNSLHKKTFFKSKVPSKKYSIDMDSNQSNSKKENKFTITNILTKYSIF